MFYLFERGPNFIRRFETRKQLIASLARFNHYDYSAKGNLKASNPILDDLAMNRNDLVWRYTKYWDNGEDFGVSSFQYSYRGYMVFEDDRVIDIRAFKTEILSYKEPREDHAEEMYWIRGQHKKLPEKLFRKVPIPGTGKTSRYGCYLRSPHNTPEKRAVPLPYVLTPRILALLFCCKAPEKISDAEALPSSTRTTVLIFVNLPPFLALNSSTLPLPSSCLEIRVVSLQILVLSFL
jgi:hypothetical protein